MLLGLDSEQPLPLHHHVADRTLARGEAYRELAFSPTDRTVIEFGLVVANLYVTRIAFGDEPDFRPLAFQGRDGRHAFFSNVLGFVFFR